MNKNVVIARTASGSVYTVDNSSHTIRGGKLGELPIPFLNCRPVMAGQKLVVRLMDGRTLQTSCVMSVNSSGA